ncbi:MAG TPA: hypothetical protein DDW51_04740 [Cyanobacteria bacterium UBA11367]|nr:hypothetical protein [Cyanobacteria bacterium UBA11367]
MIGLAISMGASGLLLPQQGDEAMAVEPIATEPTLTNLPSTAERVISAPSSAEPETSPVAQESRSAKQESDGSKINRPPVVEHKVEQGETLWQLSKNYEVQPEAIAASNKNVESTIALSPGKTLKIPTANGIVHEVKTGETVQTLSKSYGVNPTQVHTLGSVSESEELPTGESVTISGQVDDLLKARQENGLESLKEQRNRLNQSLAELGSEESTKVSKLERGSTKVQSGETALNSGKPITSDPQMAGITVPNPARAASPTDLSNLERSKADSAKSESPSQSPVVIPALTPEIAASPATIQKDNSQFQSPIVIPVPTPETVGSPTVPSKAGSQPQPSAVMPVTSPNTAASLAVDGNGASKYSSGVAIPVPTPETATAQPLPPQPITIPNTQIESVTTREAIPVPRAPQPVVIQTVPSTGSGNVYRVKPGDTLGSIARRYGLSPSELRQANGLTNPNLIRVNQALKIPGTTGTTSDTVAFIPGIANNTNTSNSNNSASSPEARATGSPTLVVSSVPTSISLVVPQAPGSQPKAVRSTVIAESNLDGVTASASTSGIDSQSNRVADSRSNNPYVDRLRSDILRVREEYRRQGSTSESVPNNTVVPTVTATPVLDNRTVSTTTNPEFNPRRYELENQQASIPINVPPPESGSSTSKSQQVAVAPAPPGSYNPMLQTPVGETVSPELPPLSAPDNYLPGSPSQFNGYIWPSKGVLTSGYGWRWGRMHKGIDIAAPIGTPIVAAADGIVVSAGWNSGGYGNLVEIKHPDGSMTRYAHNNRILVRQGQEVAQGQQISEMGSTGFSTGPHLHFEVHPGGGAAVNPMAFLPKQR